MILHPKFWLTLFLVIVVVTPQRADDASNLDSVVALLELIIDIDEDSARKSLHVIAKQTQSGELNSDAVAALQKRLDGLLTPIIADPKHGLRFDAAVVASSWKSDVALMLLRSYAADVSIADSRRADALHALVAVHDDEVVAIAKRLLASTKTSNVLRAATITALGSSKHADVADLLLDVYDRLPAELRPRVVDVLTQRPDWSLLVLRAMSDGKIKQTDVNANQVRSMQAFKNAELNRLITQKWGTVRTDRNPERERIVREMKSKLSKTHGDPYRGAAVFHKVCGQCHTIHGKGQKVGPDLTGNGRASFDQLLSNVFDPSLVIGASYQARAIATDEGRVLTGLLVEDSEQRIVLRMQGGKEEVIPRDAIEAISVSRLSLMPEGLEKQLKPHEIADLFAFITLDLPPENEKARRIPGSPTFAK